MRVLLGMSGGLDSAWSARALLKEGHEVVGAYLAMHGDGGAEEARLTAAELGIPLLEIDCRERFRTSVIEYFAKEYRAGRTPNPCIVCNSDVKLRELVRAADERNFDKIATGHYARIDRSEGQCAILRGVDPRRDQSYVLWRVDRSVLSRLLLPLGEMRKQEVREQAREASLRVSESPESREICFIPDRDYAAYIEREFGVQPSGDFVDTDGKVLGKHRGILHYTVGQRRGLGIATGERMYVSRIEPDTARVVLSRADEGAITEFFLEAPHFSGCRELEVGESLHAEVALRYQATPIKATLLRDASGYRVLPDVPVRTVTPGQSAVFYKGDRLLLGGFIRI